MSRKSSEAASLLEVVEIQRTGYNNWLQTFHALRRVRGVLAPNHPGGQSHFGLSSAIKGTGNITAPSTPYSVSSSSSSSIPSFSSSTTTFPLSSSYTNATTSCGGVIYWELNRVMCGPESKASVGCTLHRSRFGAMVLALASDKLSTSIVSEGSILFDINGVVVVMESFQSISRRLESLISLPVCLRFVNAGRVYDAVFWELDMGIVWCGASDLAQVESISEDGLAYVAGVRAGDIIININDAKENEIKYVHAVERLRHSSKYTTSIEFAGPREFTSQRGSTSEAPRTSNTFYSDNSSRSNSVDGNDIVSSTSSLFSFFPTFPKVPVTNPSINYPAGNSSAQSTDNSIIVHYSSILRGFDDRFKSSLANATKSRSSMQHQDYSSYKTFFLQRWKHVDALYCLISGVRTKLMKILPIKNDNNNVISISSKGMQQQQQQQQQQPPPPPPQQQQQKLRQQKLECDSQLLVESTSPYELQWYMLQLTLLLHEGKYVSQIFSSTSQPLFATLTESTKLNPNLFSEDSHEGDKGIQKEEQKIAQTQLISFLLKSCEGDVSLLCRLFWNVTSAYCEHLHGYTNEEYETHASTLGLGSTTKRRSHSSIHSAIEKKNSILVYANALVDMIAIFCSYPHSDEYIQRNKNYILRSILGSFSTSQELISQASSLIDSRNQTHAGDINDSSQNNFQHEIFEIAKIKAKGSSECDQSVSSDIMNVKKEQKEIRFQLLEEVVHREIQEDGPEHENDFVVSTPIRSDGGNDESLRIENLSSLHLDERHLVFSTPTSMNDGYTLVASSIDAAEGYSRIQAEKSIDENIEDDDEIDNGIDTTWHSIESCSSSEAGEDERVTYPPSQQPQQTFPLFGSFLTPLPSNLRPTRSVFSIFNDSTAAAFSPDSYDLSTRSSADFFSSDDSDSMSTALMLSRQCTLMDAVRHAVKSVHANLTESHNAREERLRASLWKRAVKGYNQWPVPSPLHPSEIFLESLDLSKCRLLRSSKYPVVLAFTGRKRHIQSFEGSDNYYDNNNDHNEGDFSDSSPESPPPPTSLNVNLSHQRSVAKSVNNATISSASSITVASTPICSPQMVPKCKYTAVFKAISLSGDVTWGDVPKLFCRLYFGAGGVSADVILHWNSAHNLFMQLENSETIIECIDSSPPSTILIMISAHELFHDSDLLGECWLGGLSDAWLSPSTSLGISLDLPVCPAHWASDNAVLSPSPLSSQHELSSSGGSDIQIRSISTPLGARLGGSLSLTQEGGRKKYGSVERHRFSNLQSQMSIDKTHETPEETTARNFSPFDYDASVIATAEAGLVTPSLQSSPISYLMLYKREDDIRQDEFIMQLIRLIDEIWRSDALDMKLTHYNVLSVGYREGLIEWVDGAVPLSCVIQEYGAGGENNPIQAFMRRAHFSPSHPYFIHEDVMETFLRSCAGYSVITYVLGVGDRHLDNLMMKPSGEFFHIDFGYIFGRDPKPFRPDLRFTQEMLMAMGGEDSPLYVKFLTLSCMAYNSLRHSATLVLSVIRLMSDAGITDLSIKQQPFDAIVATSDRLHLEMDDQQASTHMRGVIADNLSAVMPVVMEQMHRLATTFR